ncbi:signal transduction histidine kinase [Striga asiatica]|uniref:Signal transduction histidine kinase n=1 Tax=Striga asiatica TaxID=4170 RepID=A0A5A7QLA5_STRAF|nr:signal transduction histidine kinase [Striga asiatica]
MEVANGFDVTRASRPSPRTAGGSSFLPAVGVACCLEAQPVTACRSKLRLSLKAAGGADGGEEGAEHGVDLKSRVMLATVRIALRMQTSCLRCVVKAEKLL